MDVQQYFDDKPVGLFSKGPLEVTELVDDSKNLEVHIRAKENLGGIAVPFQIVDQLRVDMALLGITLNTRTYPHALVRERCKSGHTSLYTALMNALKKGYADEAEGLLGNYQGMFDTLAGRGAMPVDIGLEDFSVAPNGELWMRDLGGISFDVTKQVRAEVAAQVDAILTPYCNFPGAAGLYARFGGHAGWSAFGTDRADEFFGLESGSARRVPDIEL